MQITRSLIDEIVAHAREDLPNECCGMIGGADGEARTVYRARNEFESPLRFGVDSNDLFRITQKEMPGRDEDLVAIYHSHTKSPAYPSQTDINLALAEAGGERVQLFPGTIYLIASLAEGEVPLRGFNIDADGVHEVELTIE